MVTIKKTGFGPWRKTIVEHAGKTEVYSGNAEVTEKNGTVCVAEKSIFSAKSACYLDSDKGKQSENSIPDGTIVGKSKSITIEKNDGTRKTYDSSITSINSMEKSGGTVTIVKNGIFGKKVVATMKANDISKIESEDCNICKATNPIYKE